MTSLPRLVAFDLDDTLAPSKSALDPRMAELLVGLLERTSVCIISGGQIVQFQNQVLDHLGAASADALGRLHLMPTCGTRYDRYDGTAWTTVYKHDLSDDQKSRALGALETEAKRLGLWAEETWGPILEDRGSQITFSALGQAAPVAEKTAWDADGAKKESLRAAVQALLPDLEVRSGGSTSVDITMAGVDKAFGMTRLAEHTGIPLTEMVFVGDRLDEGGNDYPVLALGVPSVAVHGWQDTAAYLESLGL